MNKKEQELEGDDGDKERSKERWRERMNRSCSKNF